MKNSTLIGSVKLHLKIWKQTNLCWQETCWESKEILSESGDLIAK